MPVRQLAIPIIKTDRRAINQTIYRFTASALSIYKLQTVLICKNVERESTNLQLPSIVRAINRVKQIIPTINCFEPRKFTLYLLTTTGERDRCLVIFMIMNSRGLLNGDIFP